MISTQKYAPPPPLPFRVDPEIMPSSFQQWNGILGLWLEQNAQKVNNIFTNDLHSLAFFVILEWHNFEISL